MRYIPGIFLALAALCAAACADNDTRLDQRPVVEFLIRENDLGDGSYIDNIFDGICRAYEYWKGDGLTMILTNVDASDEGNIEEALERWCSLRHSRKLLVYPIIGSEEFFRNHPQYTSSEDAAILVLDANPGTELYSRIIHLYGTAYMAGQVVAKVGMDKAGAICGEKDFGPTDECLSGFMDGYRSAGGTITEEDIYYMTDISKDGGAYDSPDDLYKFTLELKKKGYNFLLPICGGSSQGLYRYTRRYEVLYADNALYTSGIDTDQQAMSEFILFSLVKKYDEVVYNFIGEWLAGVRQPVSGTMGLDSGKEDFVPASLYTDIFSSLDMDGIRMDAISAEAEYFSARQ